MARGEGVEGGYWGETLPPVPPPVWQRRLFIDRMPDLRSLAEDLAGAHTIAIDAEFTQPRVRAPSEPAHRLALLQLAIDDDYRASYVIDALRLADLSALQSALENGAIVKLFHGISADARVLATRGLYAYNTLDLEAVSRSIFGQRESGLQAMLQRACGIRLDKSLQRADWARRPLTPAMVAYAARDAEMTYVLYGWLSTHYPWAIAIHEQPADADLPDVVPWLLSALESPRQRSLEQSLAEAGLLRDTEAQVRDVRHALAVVRQLNHRVRIMRVVSDLDLAVMAPDLRPYLTALPSEERAGAARALGRLRDWQSQTELRHLLTDPVQDVRQAAATALEYLTGPSRQPPKHSRVTDGGARAWVIASEAQEEVSPQADDWRARLLQQFGGAESSDASESGHVTDAAFVAEENEGGDAARVTPDEPPEDE